MRILLRVLTGAFLLLGLSSAAQTTGNSQHIIGGNKLSHASGSFEVKITPVDSSEIGKKAGVGRMTIDKKWAGALTGESQGEMLTSVTDTTGAMAYVAMEKFTGSLAGKTGSFVFLHNATMNRNDPKSGAMNIAIVEGSGTGELSGITGKLKIVIDGGTHTYELEYELP